MLYVTSVVYLALENTWNGSGLQLNLEKVKHHQHRSSFTSPCLQLRSTYSSYWLFCLGGIVRHPKCRVSCHPQWYTKWKKKKKQSIVNQYICQVRLLLGWYCVVWSWNDLNQMFFCFHPNKSINLWLCFSLQERVLGKWMNKIYWHMYTQHFAEDRKSVV